MGKLRKGNAKLKGVDPRLLDIVQHAVAAVPYDAVITPKGGKRGKGDLGNHSKGYAIDVQLYDGDKVLPNRGTSAYAAYEQYAQAARVYQLQKYPDLPFRTGLGFATVRGGDVLDPMHLDIRPGGSMPLYDWNHGGLGKYAEYSNGGLGGAEGARRVSQIKQQLAGSKGLVPPLGIPPKIVDVTTGGKLPNGASIPANALADRAREGDGKIQGIVFHHTGGADLSGAMVTSQSAGYGAQYYIDTDGTIYRYAPDSAKMLNIRSPGTEGRTDAGLPTANLSNDNVIGIEIVGADSESFTQAQKDAAAELAGYLSGQYGIAPSMIVGHGELQGGEGGSKMPTEGVSIAYAAREYVIGNSALSAIDDALGAPMPFPRPSFKDQLEAIRVDREEQLSWGSFTSQFGVPLPAPAMLNAPLPDIAPVVDNENGGLTFAPNTGSLADIMRERYGPTYVAGGAGDASIYEQLGLPAPTAAPPTKAPLTMLGKPRGMVEPGNIDLDKRQVVRNPDGSISTEESVSVNIDGAEVLIPTVFDGKHHTDDEAVDHYRQTGEHLGKFATPEEADEYANNLHRRQDLVYNGSPKPKIPLNPYVAPTEAETRAEQAAMRSGIGSPPTKRVVPTIKVRLNDLSRMVGNGVAPAPNIPPPAPGIRTSDTGTMRLGRPIVMVEDDPVIQRAPAPSSVPRETAPIMLPASLRNGDILTQTDLKWVPPKTLREALAGSSYASAAELSKVGFVLDKDPAIKPPPKPVTEAETRDEQRQVRARPPSQSVISPPAPGTVMKPDDYNELVKRGTEASPANPDWAMPRQISWNEGWTDRGKNQARLITTTQPYPDAPKQAPTPAPAPKFRTVVESVANPAYTAWEKKYGGGLPAPAPNADSVGKGLGTFGEFQTDLGIKPAQVAPIVPPAPSRTIQVERQVAIAPTPRPRPSGGTPAGDYTIQRGDSLSVIAARTGVSVSALQRANGITDPNKIIAGAKLVIPGKSSISEQAPAKGTPAPSRNNGAPTPAPSSTSKAKPVYVNSRGETVTPQVVKVYDPDSGSYVDRTVYR